MLLKCRRKIIIQKVFSKTKKYTHLNESIYKDNGGSWHDYSFTIDDIKSNDLDSYESAIREVIKKEFGSEDRIFIKDPRMCLLFPLWEKVLKEMGYKIKVIFAWRSPMEVAHSLAARNEMAIEKSLMIWSHHFFQAEKYSRDYERFVVRYDNDFRDLDAFFTKLGEFLGVEPTEEMHQAAHELYTPKLKHHLVELKSITHDLPAYLRELIYLLMSNEIGNKEKLDKLHEDFNYSKTYYLYDQAHQKEELDKRSQNILEQQEQINKLQQLNDERVNELESSIRELAVTTDVSNQKDQKISQLEAILNNAQLQLEEKKIEIDTIRRETEATKLESRTTKHELEVIKRESGAIKFKVESIKRKLKSVKKRFKISNCELESTKQELEAKKQSIDSLELRFANAEQIFHTLFHDKARYNKLQKQIRGKNALIKTIKAPFMKKETKELLKEKELIAKYGLFSPLYYLSIYPDVWQSGMDPLMHFCEYGWKEGRLPSADFDIATYINDNPRISRQNINPLVHFIKKNQRFAGSNVKDTCDRIMPALSRYFKKGDAYAYYEPVLTPEIIKEIAEFKESPLMSIIVPVYNVEKKWLEKAVLSVENQWYENWEINIADDASSNVETIDFLKSLDNPKINIKYLKENGNISMASNEALKMAGGNYIVLMDHDDELTPDALYELVKSINHDRAEFIYSDEDKLEMDGSFCDPHFKPDFAPDTFLSTNYLSHLGAIKKSLVDKVGGFSVGLEGAQDYDLYLKVLEHTTKISHIQKVLYHWRKIPGSTAASFGEKSYANEAGRLALQRCNGA